MATRVAVMSIIVENPESVEKLNLSCTKTDNISSAEWASLTGKRRSVSFPLPWMPPRMPFPPCPVKSAISPALASKRPIPV